MSSGNIKVHCCGLEENGHCFALEYNNETIILDGGLSIVLYETLIEEAQRASYDHTQGKIFSDPTKVLAHAPILRNVNLKTVQAFCLSHEHSDHVDAVPFIYRELQKEGVDPPVFSTKPAIDGLKYKFQTYRLKSLPKFYSVEDSSELPKRHRAREPRYPSLFKAKIGSFTVMWVPAEHSTLNAYSLAVLLPKKGDSKRMVFYSGDFKLDQKEGRPPMHTIRELGEDHETLLICETIGVKSSGMTGVEDLMAEKLEEYLTNLDKRLILVAIRSTEVPRIHAFEVIATKLGRRIGLVGTYMTKAYEAMRKSFPGILRGDYKIFVMSKKNVKKGMQWLGDLQPKDYRKYILLAEARMWQTYTTDFHQIMKAAAPLPQDEKHAACISTDEELAKTGKLEIGRDDIVIFSTTDPYTDKMRICKMHVERHVKASKALFYPELHISGHGQVCDYRILMEALKPKVVIPFHREKADRDLLQIRVLEYLEPVPQFFNPPTNGTTYEWTS